MTQNAIIPLLKQFREKTLSANDLHEKLESIVQFCERKQKKLGQVRILATDLESWQTYLKPALELSYKGLVAAAKMGQEYAKNPSQEIAEAIVYAFVQVDKSIAFVEKHSSNVSSETQSILQEEISQLPQDASNIPTIQQGHAQVVASIFND